MPICYWISFHFLSTLLVTYLTELTDNQRITSIYLGARVCLKKLNHSQSMHTRIACLCIVKILLHPIWLFHLLGWSNAWHQQNTWKRNQFTDTQNFHIGNGKEDQGLNPYGQWLRNKWILSLLECLCICIIQQRSQEDPDALPHVTYKEL